MFTILFWKAAAERAAKAGSNVAITSFVLGDKIFNAFDVDWSTTFGVFLGGALVSVLMSIASDAATGSGPSLTNVEVIPGNEGN